MDIRERLINSFRLASKVSIVNKLRDGYLLFIIFNEFAIIRWQVKPPIKISVKKFPLRFRNSP